jgi:hypothetical protein
MISSGRLEPLPFSRAMMLARAGSLGRQHHRDAVGFQRLLDVLGHARFVAGRVAAVDLHQRLEMAHGFVVDFGPVGSLSARGQPRNG